MNLVVGICLLFASSAVFAQNWPLPANTPNVEVPCANCSGTAKGKLTAAYQDPIGGFTGRWLDSTDVIDWQAGFRTGRAYFARYSPQKGRIYLKIGSGLGAYSKSSFFSRLEAREQLAPVTSIFGLTGFQSSHTSLPEIFLRWDQWFYAESSFSGWRTIIEDGQDRLSGFSIDDRGNVYLAYSVFGWGVVKDTGAADSSSMRGVQFFNDAATRTPNDILSPSDILVVKTSNGKYYALIEGGGPSLQNVYDVTDVDNPVRQGTDFRTVYTSAAPTADRTALVSNGNILIYNNDAFAVNGQPNQTITPPAGGRYTNVDTDGTNFYATMVNANYNLFLLKLTPNDSTRNSFGGTPTLMPASAQLDARQMRYGDGYIAVVVNDFQVGVDLRLYRVDPGGFTEIPTNHYFNDYYIAVGGYKADTSNYVSVGHGLIYDALPIKNGNKVNVIVSAYDIGDVYSIRSDDDVTVTVQGNSGTVNPNAPARPGGKLFYGDRVRFLGSTTSSTPKSINWNFGNSEAAAGADPNTVLNSSTGLAVDHQYSGITPSTLGATRLVTATNAAGSGSGQAAITLSTPTARVGVSNGTTGFTFITDATSAARAPIVAGDVFYDASDGDVEGHYNEWTIDTAAAVAKVPFSGGSTSNYAMGVGACGAHTLTFTAHYGPYTNFATAGGAEFRVPLSSLSYNVQPFAAAINPTYVSDAVSLTFSSISRASIDTSSLPSGQAAALNWRWDLVDSASPENVVVTGPAGTGAASSIPSWSIPKTNFTTTGLRVRLMISTSALTGGCAGKETSKAFSQALNGPDPSLSGGCTNGGPPCTFNVTSLSAVNMTSDNWHFSWSATGPSIVGAGEDKSSYSPFFTAVGTYTVSVTVTNAIGSKTVTTPVTITTAGPLCPTMSDFNMYPAYRNSALSCTISQNAGCTVGTSLSFSPQTNGYDLNCAPHTFEWDFGDNTAHSTDQNATHTYTTQGTYPITMTVKNGGQTFVAHGQIVIGGGVIQPPPTQQGCPTMTAFNVFASYRGSSAPCNTSQQTCGKSEVVTFTAQANSYDFGCANHTFQWSFGDNTFGSGSSATHAYANAGVYNVTLTVSNPSQSNYVSTIPITITGGGGGNSCPTMSDLNLFPAYRNASLSCSVANNAGCTTSEALSFFPATSGYDLNCSTHTYDWNFGDNTAHSTLQNPSHQYTNAGTYTITMKVHNSQQDYTATGIIVVKSIPVQPAFTADFTASTPDTTRPFLAVFTPSVDPVTTGVTKVTWDFGDGSQISKSSLVQVTNLYSKAGSYTVTITIEASGGGTATKTHVITLTAPSRTRAVRH